MIKNLLCLIVFLYQWGVIAQTSIDTVGYGSARVRVNEFLRNNLKIQRVRYSNGQTIVLSDIRNGIPIFEATDNSTAGANVGINALTLGGELGLSLTGSGIQIGIWDGGRVKNDHIELDSRVFPSDGASNFDNHATHVAGTILATGMNTNAKGIATESNAVTFDFDGDLSEMASLARTDQSGLILSNHSYGTIAGWHFDGGWSWFGDSNISNTEDYKFGFYDSKARQLDQMAFNAPYYTIVKSAGNDRNNTGDGSKPPDPQYNSISTFGNAKNIITVGAVNKLSGSYEGPWSVQMTDFSSWGPTDDGRVKPDIVAPGANLLSTFASSINSYGSLSGTSMASPVVTGSIALLQELYKGTHGGQVMKSSTVKALIIHTAKESGPHQGPDYQFGWGILDAHGAAEHILKENQESHFIIEARLNQGQLFELELNPELGKRIRVTLTWTDPAGIVPAISLNPTQLNLVNDLDVSLEDEAGEIFFPWVLNPLNPNEPPTKGNNIRDNVEKLELDAPLPRTYTLKVTSKGQLLNSFQDFSLLIDYSPEIAASEARYWVGGSGDWSDPNHWSQTSGGGSSGQVPESNHKVIFDENSFADNNQRVTLPQNYECAGVSIFSSKLFEIDLQENELVVTGNLINTSSNNTIRDGKLRLKSTKSGSSFDSKQVHFPGVDIFVEPNIDLEIKSDISCKAIYFNSGSTSVKSTILHLESLVVSPLVQLVDFSGIELSFHGVGEFVVPEIPDFINNASTKLTIQPNSLTKVNISGQSMEGHFLNLGGELQVISADSIGVVEGSGKFTFYGDNRVGKLVISGDSEIVIEGTKNLMIFSDLVVNSTSSTPIEIVSLSMENATLTPLFHSLKCFDYLNISNVNVTSGSFLNAGLNSSIINSTGWLEQECLSIVFPDFTVESPCKDSHMILTNESIGPVDGIVWAIDGETFETDKLIIETGNRTEINVGLTVGASGNMASSTYNRKIDLIDNTVPTVNYLVQNDGKIVSFLQGDKYYWLFDNELVDKQGRTVDLEPNVKSYQVLVFRGRCNRISDQLVLTSIEIKSPTLIYPNPVANEFIIQTSKTLERCLIYTSVGNLIESNTSVTGGGYQVQMSNPPQGLLLVLLRFNDGSVQKIKLTKGLID